MKCNPTGCIKKLLFLFGVMALGSCAAQENISVSPERSVAGEPVTELYLFADERDLERLFSRNPRSDSRIEGYVRIGERGRIRTLRQGFRFRGNTTRYHQKKSYNIRFEHPQPFLFNSPRMNLNALYTDPSAMREKMSWDMFHELGRPASKTRYFALHINGNFEGLGLHVQRVDEVLLRHNNLDPNGTLVRDLTRRRAEQAGIDRRSVFGHNLSAEHEPEAFLATLFNSRWAPDNAALAELVQWVHDTPAGPEFNEGFRQRVDAEVFTDWLAVHYLIGDVDAFGDDYWLHRGNASGSKWIVIPWDHDLSFGKNERDNLRENRSLGQYGRGISQLNEFFAYEYPIDDAGWDNELVSRFLETEELMNMLKSRLTELMSDYFPVRWYQEQIGLHSSVIEEWLLHKPEGAYRLHGRQHHGAPDTFSYHQENLIDFVHLRYAFLDRQINPIDGNPYEAEITVNGPGLYLLTDAAGWTVASFEVTDIEPRNPVGLRIISRNAAVENGISREWELRSEGNISGTLSLFYRNDIAPDGKENWYSEDDAVGRQWELAIIKDGQRLESRPNPYSNKVSATVSLSKTHSFGIELP